MSPELIQPGSPGPALARASFRAPCACMSQSLQTLLYKLSILIARSSNDQRERREPAATAARIATEPDGWLPFAPRC